MEGRITRSQTRAATLTTTNTATAGTAGTHGAAARVAVGPSQRTGHETPELNPFPLSGNPFALLSLDEPVAEDADTEEFESKSEGDWGEWPDQEPTDAAHEDDAPMPATRRPNKRERETDVVADSKEPGPVTLHARHAMDTDDNKGGPQSSAVTIHPGHAMPHGGPARPAGSNGFVFVLRAASPTIVGFLSARDQYVVATSCTTNLELISLLRAHPDLQVFLGSLAARRDSRVSMRTLLPPPDEATARGNLRFQLAHEMLLRERNVQLTDSSMAFGIMLQQRQNIATAVQDVLFQPGAVSFKRLAALLSVGLECTEALAVLDACSSVVGVDPEIHSLRAEVLMRHRDAAGAQVDGAAVVEEALRALPPGEAGSTGAQITVARTRLFHALQLQRAEQHSGPHADHRAQLVRISETLQQALAELPQPDGGPHAHQLGLTRVMLLHASGMTHEAAEMLAQYTPPPRPTRNWGRTPANMPQPLPVSQYDEHYMEAAAFLGFEEPTILSFERHVSDYVMTGPIETFLPGSPFAENLHRHPLMGAAMGLMGLDRATRQTSAWRIALPEWAAPLPVEPGTPAARRSTTASVAPARPDTYQTWVHSFTDPDTGLVFRRVHPCSTGERTDVVFRFPGGIHTHTFNDPDSRATANHQVSVHQRLPQEGFSVGDPLHDTFLATFQSGPPNPEATWNLAREYASRGRIDWALAAMDHLEGARGSDALTVRWRAEILMIGGGDSAAALAAAEQAVALDATPPQAQNTLARARLFHAARIRAPDPEGATRLALKALDGYPFNSMEAGPTEGGWPGTFAMLLGASGDRDAATKLLQAHWDLGSVESARNLIEAAASVGIPHLYIESVFTWMEVSSRRPWGMVTATRALESVRLSPFVPPITHPMWSGMMQMVGLSNDRTRDSDIELMEWLAPASAEDLARTTRATPGVSQGTSSSPAPGALGGNTFRGRRDLMQRHPVAHVDPTNGRSTTILCVSSSGVDDEAHAVVFKHSDGTRYVHTHTFNATATGAR